MVFEKVQQQTSDKDISGANVSSENNEVEVDVIKDLDLKFKLPFRCIVQGSTG